MSVQPENDGFEYTFVGDLKVGDEVRTYGKVTKIERGSMTHTIYFDNKEFKMSCRSWHTFHSVEVKKS
jgi:hypothetical protein